VCENQPPSIPVEKLLRAQLIRLLYSIRNERWLMEEIDSSTCSGGLSAPIFENSLAWLHLRKGGPGNDQFNEGFGPARTSGR
jgi:hypothetical protein